MATLKPFRMLRPNPSVANQVCSPPYDVMSTEEARAMAEGNPLSFLRVTRAEIEFDEDADPYSDEVYARGAENLAKLQQEGHLVREPAPSFMIYRLIMGDHTQLGLVAVASCKEYDEGIVRKHELTRPDKENDRTRHINILGAQTGPVFLTYKARPSIDDFLSDFAQGEPEIDYTAPDGIRHSGWIVREHGDVAIIESLFKTIPELYIADGHHRSAAASRVARQRLEKYEGILTGEEPWNYFLTVSFPDDQMQVLPYNRAVKDLNGLTGPEFLDRLREVADLAPIEGDPQPTQKGQVAVYIEGSWHLATWKPDAITGRDSVGSLDASILQDLVLEPLLGIGDPRIDKRISFIGGIRGTGELVKLVDSGKYAVAFALYPTSMADLMKVADEDKLMPPKSTWFEPKLRDAMATHLLD